LPNLSKIMKWVQSEINTSLSLIIESHCPCPSSYLSRYRYHYILSNSVYAVVIISCNTFMPFCKIFVLFTRKTTFGMNIKNNYHRGQHVLLILMMNNAVKKYNYENLLQIINFLINTEKYTQILNFSLKWNQQITSLM
jgi:hypothetical protein